MATQIERRWEHETVSESKWEGVERKRQSTQSNEMALKARDSKRKQIGRRWEQETVFAGQKLTENAIERKQEPLGTESSSIGSTDSCTMALRLIQKKKFQPKEVDRSSPHLRIQSWLPQCSQELRLQDIPTPREEMETFAPMSACLNAATWPAAACYTRPRRKHSGHCLSSPFR